MKNAESIYGILAVVCVSVGSLICDFMFQNQGTDIDFQGWSIAVIGIVLFIFFMSLWDYKATYTKDENKQNVSTPQS